VHRPLCTVCEDPECASRHRPLCISCDLRESGRESLLCAGCVRRLREHLDEIGRGFGRLDAAPGAAPVSAGPRAPGFESRSPARDDVLVLTDRRRVHRAAHDPDTARNAPASLVTVVLHWADEARDAELIGPPQRVFEVDRRGQARVLPRRVVDECALLADRAERLGREWWAGDMCRDLDAAARHLRRALGEHEATIPLGECPRPAVGYAALYEAVVGELGPTLAGRGARVPRCRGQVRARALGHSAQCTRCRYRWDGEATLRRLGAQLGEAMLDLGGLSRYLDVESHALLRKWAQRDQWQRERHGRRTLYSLADARASWQRAQDRAAAARATVSGAA
jgi:hypothetical protein